MFNQVRIFITTAFVFLTIYSFASSPLDSIGAENNNGKLLILHKIQPKENYYSLARKYGVLPSAIINFNNNQALKIGTIVKVPTERPYSTESFTQKMAAATQPAEQSGDIITYKVGAKETLFAISKRFNTTVDEIKKLNNLTSNNLRFGQILQIRQESPTTLASTSTPAILPAKTSAPEPQIAKVIPDAADSDTNTTGKTETISVPSNRYGLREHSDHGVAVWIDDENLDGTKMLALHKTAPIGTIIKVTNPMTSKSTFAKVVGKYTENESTKDVIIVITKATADLIGALDKRFQVNIDYGVPYEQ